MSRRDKTKRRRPQASIRALTEILKTKPRRKEVEAKVEEIPPAESS